MRQEIEFVSLCVKRHTFDKRDAFQLREDRPAAWLQKGCFFVLRKLRAFYVGEALTIERHTINASTFMNRLFEQKQSLIGLFNIKPRTLLIGSEDYAYMMKEQIATRQFSFHAEYYSKDRVMGMTVKVIPWMRGVLVMPPD